MQVLTDSEKLLLASVGLFSISLTAIVIFCVVRKSCWLHKVIWEDEKKKKQRMDDIICIRYPPDMYPTSLGVYRENAFRSPEEELSRLFHSPLKRDSTYSSMSETSSGYELSSSSQHASSGSNTTTVGSPITANLNTTPENSPEHQGQKGHNTKSPMVPVPVVPVPVGQDRRISYSQLTPGVAMITNRSTAAALAAEAAISANQRFNLQPSLNQPMRRQPFFTFILKYEEDNGLVHIEFIEARNLPPKEYVSQPSDAFFTLEIQPKKVSDRKKEMLRYRFVTKTIKKAGEICEFSEKFLAQLAKTQLKEYMIRFSGFDQDRFGNPTEIGTTTLDFDDFRDFTTNKLVLSCSLKEPVLKRGELMIGMCYLPTAERMSVTIVKLNNLNPYYIDGTITKETICYVRVLLLRAETGKVIRKKKTTFKKLSGSTPNQPVFNETIVFDMPASKLVHTVILCLVCLTDKPLTSKDHKVEMEQSQETYRNPLNRQSHPPLANKESEESLFHYSDNLNKAKRMNSNNSGQSGSSQATSVSEDRRRSSSQHSSDSASPQRDISDAGSFDTEKSQRVKDSVVGKVALGYCIRNPMGKYHWEKMITLPRNVVTEWHSLK